MSATIEIAVKDAWHLEFYQEFIRVTAACTGMVTIQGTSATTVAIIS